MYFIVLLILSVFLLIQKNDKGLSFLIILYCFVFASRSELVPDTLNYIDMFKGNYYGGTVEMGFLTVCTFFNSIGFSFSVFLFLVSIIALFLWKKITRTFIEKKYLILSFIIYMSYMGIYYNGVVLRAYIAIMIVYCGIYGGIIKRKNYFLFYISCLVAGLFHISALAFIVIPLIFNRHYNSYLLYICVGGSFAVMLLGSSIDLITKLLSEVTNRLSILGGDRFGNYLSRAEGGAVSLNSLKYLMSGLICIYVRDKVPRDKITNGTDLFLNTYLGGISLYFILSFIPSASRLAQLFLFFEFIPLTMLYYKAPGKLRWLLQIFIVIVILANYVSLFRFIPQLYNY